MDTPSPDRLSPAPRPIPLVLTIRILFGGALNQFGWGIMAFGLIFVWVFDASGAISSALAFTGDLASAQGVSSGWHETSMTVNDERVYETSFSFRSSDGYEVRGSSYRTGGYVEAGEPVTIEYRLDDPSVSRIVGMRSSMAGAWVAFVLIFPLVGLGLTVVGMRKGLRARRLMATGELALGRLTSKEATSTQINNQTVYRYTFAFDTPSGGTYEVVGKTHRTFELEDEERERIVYDPLDPADATVLDELPCHTYVDAHGDFVPEGSSEVLRAALNLVIPAAAVLCWLAYTVLRG